ncbi:hypothetical protein [Arthrobacter rhombi]|uniref:hypothetical protein n=1 Tax=Arthrobacter rhombi TaxID=71253 RepID=UPI003FCF49D8
MSTLIISHTAATGTTITGTTAGDGANTILTGLGWRFQRTKNRWHLPGSTNTEPDHHRIEATQTALADDFALITNLQQGHTTPGPAAPQPTPPDPSLRQTQALQRKIEKQNRTINRLNRTLSSSHTVANHTMSIHTTPTGQRRARAEELLAAESARLVELEEELRELIDAGAVVVSAANISPGDRASVLGRWYVVEQVNRRTVTLAVSGGRRNKVEISHLDGHEPQEA